MIQRILFLIMALCVGVGLNAQHYYQDVTNPDILRHAERHESCRKEIVIPMVNGYNVYKADLHTHTIYSDAQVLPSFRVMEAWQDGLDIMAVTEHIENRAFEQTMVDYLEKYVSDKYDSAVNHRISRGPADDRGILVDLNYAVRESQKTARKYGLTIIPGTEITRYGKYIGHFNALFTTDNNLIYDKDPVQTVRNAKAQGAFIMHNHPGWSRTSIDYTETEKLLYAENLIDGVEVMNGSDFYPGIIDRAIEKGLFMTANTDVHGATASEYRINGAIRPMTLILAKENTLDSIREALEARRTIAYGYNTLCGREELLKDFFAAGMSVRVVSGQDNPDKIVLMLTNGTSVPYVVRHDGENQERLDPFSTIYYVLDKSERTLKLTVLNMFCSKDRHPVVELPF